jgi:hypothetical protein
MALDEIALKSSLACKGAPSLALRCSVRELHLDFDSVMVLMVVLSMPANMAWMKALMLHLDFDLVIVLVVNSHSYLV